MADALSTLPECSFGGLRFPVQDSSVEGGNDVAEHTAYLRRGADVEPCGVQPYRFKVTIPLVNTAALVARYGVLFPDLRFDLIRAFQSDPIDRLSHPTYGDFRAAVTSWSERLSPDVRNGVMLDVTFVEHNGGASLVLAPDGTLERDTTASAERLAEDTDTQVVALGGTNPGLVAIVARELNYLAAGTRSFTQLQDAFRRMDVAVAATLALPLLVPASSHAATISALNLRTALVRLRDHYLPTAATVRKFTVPRTMPAWEVAQLVYGNASLGRTILAANSITDPLNIPAGKVLTILPLNYG